MVNRKLLNSELGRDSIEEFRQRQKLPIAVVLDNVRSQFNIGSVFRSSDAFIAEKIILCGISATPPSAEIHKSALGAEFSVDWEYFQNTEDAVANLKSKGYKIVSIEQTENSVSLNDFKTAVRHQALTQRVCVHRSCSLGVFEEDGQGLIYFPVNF